MDILLISADASLTGAVQGILPAGALVVHPVDTLEKAWTQLEKMRQQILLIDWGSREEAGMELIRRLHATDLDRFPYLILLLDPLADSVVTSSLGLIPGDWVHTPIQEMELRSALKAAERFLALQTRLKDEQYQLATVSMRDQVTGVLNRIGLYERAVAELNRSHRENTPLGLALVQVDGLVALEEYYGTEVVNQLLQMVARAIRANVRSYDVTGRWERGRFLLLLMGISYQNLGVTAERVATSISALSLAVPDGKPLRAQIHLGATWMDPLRPEDFYGLVSQCEEALEQAIRQGNQLVGLYPAGQ
jgi:diguanylate cyclase (GGDEF)-like protein